MPMLKLDGSESTEVLAVTSTSKKSTGSAPPAGQYQALPDGGFVSITARGGDVYVATGADPVAAIPVEGAPGKGHPVLAGQTQSFAISAGAKVAVIALPAA